MHAKLVLVTIVLGGNLPWPSRWTLLSSMRFIYDVLLLWLPAGCWHDKLLCNQETWVPHGLTSHWQANVGNDVNFFSLHLIFTFYLNRDTTVLQLFPVVVFQWKKTLPCWPIYCHLKPSLKLLDCGRNIQNDVHINTYYCKPELISGW